LNQSPAGSTSINAPTGQNVALKINNSSKLHVQGTTGNVGIGTTSPGKLLDVNGTFRASGEAFLTGGFDITAAGRFRDGIALNFNTNRTARIFTDTNDLIIQQGEDDKDIIFNCDDGSGGVTAYLTIDGSAGYTTAQKNIRFADSVEAQFGGIADLTISHNGSNSIIANNTGDLQIKNRADDGRIIFESDDGLGGLTEYFRVDGGSEKTIYTKPISLLDSVGLQLGTGTDAQMYHTGSEGTFINYTGNFRFIQSADDADLSFHSDDGSGGVTPYLTLDGGLGYITVQKRMQLQDSVGLYLGTSTGDLIYHNGSNTFWTHQVGDLTIETNQDDGDIIFRSDDGSGGTTAYLTLDGGLGFTTLQKNLRANDDVRILVGSGQDAEFFHDGSNTSIRNTTGDLQIRQAATDKDIIFKCDDGSGGETEYFRVDGSDEQVVFSKNLKLQDNDILRLGDANDLQIYHDGSNSFIVDAGTGDLLNYFSNEWKVIKYGSSETCIEATSDGSVDLYYDNNKKFETTSTGVEVTGNIAVSGSVQRQISTTHHTFTFGAAGSAAQDYWVPFIGSSEQAAPNVTHRTIAPYGGILKKAIVHSTVAYGSSAQVRFHRIDNGTTSVFVNDNSTDDVTTNVTADMSTAYSSVAFDFTTGNTFSAGDQIGVSFVRDNTGLGDVAITLVWEYELF
jgi:hypothetical protein